MKLIYNVCRFREDRSAHLSVVDALRLHSVVFLLMTQRLEMLVLRTCTLRHKILGSMLKDINQIVYLVQQIYEAKRIGLCCSPRLSTFLNVAGVAS
jgi:hypothetical protein